MMVLTQEEIIEAIEMRIRSKVCDIVGKVIKKARQEVDDEIRKLMPQLTLELFKDFSVMHHQDNLVITVKNYETR